HRAAGDPRRRRIGQVLFEEHLPRLLGRADTVDPAFARGDAVPGMTNEGLGDTGEVVEDFALGRPRLRVEDLVEIAKRQPMAVDGDLLLWHGHLLCAARLLAFPAAHGGVVTGRRPGGNLPSTDADLA